MSAPSLPSLRALPKAHLHVHLEGAMRRSTLSELAARLGVPAPPQPRSFGSFAHFEDLYLAAASVIRSFDDLARLVTEVIEDAATDGVVWIEPAVHLPDHARLGPPEEVLDVLVTAGQNASNRTGVGVGWLLTADRTLAPDGAAEQAEIAARNRHRGVVAFGLANDESAAPPEDFSRAFSIARDAGLISAPHAGEHRGPDSVRGALDALGADRIQHGVRAIEDGALIARLAGEGTCLDVCPTSNVALSVVPSLADHPLPRLLMQGVACSLNADDPLLFGVGILDEYRTGRDVLGLDAAALARCARTSIDHSGAPAPVKERAKRGIDRWVAEAAPPGEFGQAER